MLLDVQVSINRGSKLCVTSLGECLAIALGGVGAIG